MSNKVVIITDSTSDLGVELLNKYDIKSFPLHVTFENESYDDGIDINLEQLYAKVEESGKLPKTAAASHGEITNFFKKYLDEGYDIVYCGISSKLSVTFQVAYLVSQELEEEYGEKRVYLVDSKNLSTGIGLLILKAAGFRDKGLSAKQIKEEVDKIVPRVKSQFVINTLDYLHKGGRCSAVTLVASKVLKIKPMIVVREGSLQVGAKFVGSLKKAEKGMTNLFLNDFEKIDKEFVFITHTFNYEGAENIKSMIEPVTGEIETLYETVAGCVIGTHCGRKTIGILYIMKDEEVKKEENVIE